MSREVDEDRFFTTSKEAAFACKQAENVKEWREEFARFLAFVNTWCTAHSADVSMAYLGIREDGLKVFLVTPGSEYRFDFDDAVTDLDIQLAQKFTKVPAIVLHVPSTPHTNLSSFFPPESALVIYGQQQRAQSEGSA